MCHTQVLKNILNYRHIKQRNRKMKNVPGMKTVCSSQDEGRKLPTTIALSKLPRWLETTYPRFKDLLWEYLKAVFQNDVKIYRGLQATSVITGMSSDA